MSLDLGRFSSSKNHSCLVIAEKFAAEKHSGSGYEADYGLSEEQQIIFDILRTVKDPEHPYTIEELLMIKGNDIIVTMPGNKKFVTIYWAPTLGRCAYALHIALSMRVKLEKCLKSYDDYKITLLIKQDTHQKEKEINKQANDKERVQAAKENPKLYALIESMIR
eukprot:TRINITY_DN8039_c0_g5_i1.p1 TRINITY_DN8039_c0_g5~~TRINITY_DN8039_c0_g5_i1.p1  ORF type:complete len:165 (+),score=26.07 TRINITY_DN8039_c0_g5_i1:147-641(+)